MNKAAFFKSVRADLFGGVLKQGVVDTLTVILDTCKTAGITDLDEIAYILATAKHECYHATLNPNFAPIREGFTNTNRGAIAAVTRLYEDKKIRKNYALPAANGLSYYGRGFVQITHPENYKKLGDLLKLELYTNPDLALTRDVAAKILVYGMKHGLFTGAKVSGFNMNFADNNPKPEESARKVINGEDKKEKIAREGKLFFNALQLAVNTTETETV